MAAITVEQLKGVMPHTKNPASWLEVLNEALERFEISSRARVAAFLGQIAHESAELNRVIENLNYSVQGLRATWPKRFDSLQKAEEYARKPERIANYVYAKRLGNGDQASGDGWRFRGRGLIQLTGRGNYRATGLALGLPLESNPDVLVEPRPAALAAGYFWKSRGLNELADDRNDDNDDEDFVQITVTINGGRNGLADRRRYWQTARQVFGT
jgi:putative chitinase